MFVGNVVQLRMHGCHFKRNEHVISVRVTSCTSGSKNEINEYAELEMIGCTVEGRLWRTGEMLLVIR